MILVIAEQRDGKLNRATWETIVGAQQIAAAMSLPITVVVPGGKQASGAANDIAAAQVTEVVSVYFPEKGKKTQMIAGSPAEAAAALVKKLREDARVI